MPARKSRAEYIAMCIARHGDVFDYTQLPPAPRRTDIVTIVCKAHGPFTQTLDKHISGSKCPICAQNSTARGNRLGGEGLLDRFIKIHGDAYVYPHLNGVVTTDKINITCKLHGMFTQTVASHLKGSNCPSCARLQRSSTRSVGRSARIKRQAADAHSTKYDYSDLNDSLRVTDIATIKCPHHGAFEQIIHNHLQGAGCPKCANVGPSSGEREIAEFIVSLGHAVEFTNKTLIDPQHIDLIIPSHNIAIEYNGIRWHGEKMGRGKQYHLSKTVSCATQGYQLLHIWDTEWNSQRPIIESIIRSKLGLTERIFARKLQVVKLTTQEAREFFDANHRQRHVNGSVYLGLETNGIIMAAASFLKARYTSKVEWELLRYANKLNNTVIGGFSKLFTAFVKMMNPQSVISYADRRFSTGNVYSKCGFTVDGYTDPGYYYFNSNRPLELLSRQQFQKHKLHTLLPSYDESSSEWTNMKNNGFDRVWDCGHVKMIWHPTNKEI